MSARVIVGSLGCLIVVVLLCRLAMMHLKLFKLQQLNRKICSLVESAKFKEASDLAERTLALAAKSLPTQPLIQAKLMSNLGMQYLQMERYSEAQKLFELAINIQQPLLGPDHLDNGLTLHNLGLSYRLLHNNAQARHYYERAHDIFRRNFGEINPYSLSTLRNLASIAESEGDYDAAASMMRKVTAITRSVRGESHPSYGDCLYALATISVQAGFYEQALPYLETALSNFRMAYGANDPTVANTLDLLGVVNNALGNRQQVESQFRTALRLRKLSLGNRHQMVGASLRNLALFHVACDSVESAIAELQEMIGIETETMGKVFCGTVERARIACVLENQQTLHLVLSLAVKYQASHPGLVNTSFELVLQRKALSAAALEVQRDAILSEKYSHLRSKLERLTALRMEIARKVLAGHGPEDASVHQQQLELHQQKERLEAELARDIPEMNLEQKLRASDRRAVALALPSGVALVEFVHFQVFNFGAIPGRGDSSWLPPRYLAFVLAATEPQNVHMMDLGEAEPINQMIHDFRADITGNAEDQAGRDLGAIPAQSGSVAGRNRGTELRAAVFDKLLPALGGSKRLLLAPDGDLARLPFEVLPIDDDRRLLDDFQISYLTVGRDVLRFGAKSNRAPAEPVVVADPNFDMGSAGEATATSTEERRGRHSRDLNRELRFGHLPGTRVEGESIGSMLGVQPWLGSATVERRLKACRSPRILHLATHGFFLAEQRQDPDKVLRDIVAPGGELGRLSRTDIENPLLRSGLALAGANHWLQGGSPPEEAEDGLLTAEDVTGMDLLDTDLVVLSACETGLGEIRVGEGVFGLRRAFVLAGATTLVMSLWKVPDQQTQELMEDFYRRLLAGQGRAAALRDAQLALKARYPNPLYWGAFICQGDPAPLPG